MIVYPLPAQADDFGMLTWPSLFGLTSATVLARAPSGAAWSVRCY